MCDSIACGLCVIFGSHPVYVRQNVSVPVSCAWSPEVRAGRLTPRTRCEQPGAATGVQPSQRGRQQEGCSMTAQDVMNQRPGDLAPLDQAKQEAFAGKVLGDCAGFQSVLMGA